MMTREIRHIIQHKRFKRTWEDYLCIWEFAIPALILIYGFEITGRAAPFEKFVFGPIVLIAAFLLTKFMVGRNRQLNKFEQINNSRSQAENFEMVLKGLQSINVTDVHLDFNNATVNGRYKSRFIPPVFEWLTIVCLDNCVLVNSRPAPATMMFWLRRNAMIDFKQTLKSGGE